MIRDEIERVLRREASDVIRELHTMKPHTFAKRRCKLSPSGQAFSTATAVLNLKAARDMLREAGSKRAADYVARALKSAIGAMNHARRAAAEALRAKKVRPRARHGRRVATKARAAARPPKRHR